MKYNLLWNEKRDRRKSREQPGTFNSTRLKVTIIALGALFLLISIRAVFIHISPAKQDNLTTIAKRQYERKLNLSTYRGHIRQTRERACSF